MYLMLVDVVIRYIFDLNNIGLSRIGNKVADLN
ncbi:hypothetical protein SAMN05421545_0716 [Pontibacter lucknowensis]|uniref:Uncharacterized protein n=2 Tax=Pontibacter TaxID=323449 RepID=A0A1N6U6U7_9BACT|nr:hypothetical protein SAMN05421545_0716 [Pontibacter lucknowensis]